MSAVRHVLSLGVSLDCFVLVANGIMGPKKLRHIYTTPHLTPTSFSLLFTSLFKIACNIF